MPLLLVSVLISTTLYRSKQNQSRRCGGSQYCFPLNTLIQIHL